MSYFLQTGQAMAPQTLGVFDEDSGGLYRSKFGWSYRQRGASDNFSPDFFLAWTVPYFNEDDFAGSQGPLRANSWEPWSDAVGGMTRPYFINGRTLDSNGNPVAATVQGFVTSTGTFVGVVGSDSNGNYSLPTLFTGSNHYLVAYRAGSPDTAGTTVNTLTPGLTPG